jgi:hypothetical protein
VQFHQVILSRLGRKQKVTVSNKEQHETGLGHIIAGKQSPGQGNLNLLADQ